jgi:hypothetical protein
VVAGILAMLLGPLGCATWSSRTEDSAKAVSIAAREAWTAVRPALHARCMAAAVACASDGVALGKCGPWAACSALRRNITAAIYGLHDAAARVIEAARAGDRERAEKLAAALARARSALQGLLAAAAEKDGGR